MSKERNLRRRFLRSTALLTLATTLGFAAATSFSVASDVMPSPAYPISSVGLSVSDFKVEGLTAPEGIDVARPRFSWKLFSQDLNESQSAYQLKVAKAFGDRELVWDSGRVESDAQLFVEYDGKSLEPATEYSVELVVWNKDGSLGFIWQSKRVYLQYVNENNRRKRILIKKENYAEYFANHVQEAQTRG
jgi:hypothetical protein